MYGPRKHWITQPEHRAPAAKEPITDEPDLVLYLSFLPACSECTGDRFEQVIRSQIQKVAVEGAVLAGQYLCHYRLQVVVDALPATASEVLKGTNVGIKYHLKAFTSVGDTERHPAIRQPEVGYPDSDRLQE